MLSVLWHHFVPPSLYGGDTALPVLSKVDLELRLCHSAADAAAVLDRLKPDLYTRLRSRFEPPLAQALALKALNISLAKYHLRARSTTVLSRPFGLIVDPSNMCQLAC